MDTRRARNFGEPADIDGNGRVTLFFTRAWVHQAYSPQTRMAHVPVIEQG